MYLGVKSSTSARRTQSHSSRTARPKSLEKTDTLCDTPLTVTPPRKKAPSTSSSRSRSHGQPVSLKQLAKSLGLSTTTLSLVLNGSEKAQSIPQETKDRIFTAARALNYRPNFLARSLRSQRTFSVGVIIPELSDGYASLVLTGIEDHLLQSGYMYLVTSHRHNEKQITDGPRLLFERSVEGLIAVDTRYEQNLPIPVVTVSGHRELPDVTNIVLNHERAAELALTHLTNLGHREIAVIKGQEFSSDTAVRWEAIHKVARRLSIPVPPRLVQQMEGKSASPEVGYQAMVRLLRNGVQFTALLAFNDVCAIGAIRALREAGKRVPEDVAVIGFDDIHEARYHIPALTTVKQPLQQMGRLAAQMLLSRIAEPQKPQPPFIHVEPELIVRESTAAAKVATGAAR